MARRNFCASHIFLSLLAAGLMNSVQAAPLMALPESITPFPAWVTVVGEAQSGQSVEFQVVLKMRDLEGLRTRIAGGAKVSPTEMTAKYYPLASNYQKLSQWLTGQGLTVLKTYPNHLSVDVTGNVAQVHQALGVLFSRVTVDGVEYTAARTAPNLPADLASFIVGINGLQPYQQAYPLSRIQPFTNNAAPYLVSELLKAYGGASLTTTGSGQKTAILIDRFPLDSDLTKFWTANSIAQTLSNIEKVSVVTGVPATSPQGEESLDVEWSSGAAPGSKVRIYGTKDLSFVNLDKGYQAIINDLPSQPQLHQLSISLGACEQDLSSSQLQTDSQYLASIAAGGVSIFVSSGDSGSNNNCSSGLGVSYSASDPSITAVGGTKLTLTSSGTVATETAWACTGTCTAGGSGGGISSYFSRPSWQVGTGVPSGTKRLVPDVSLDADPNTGYYVVVNGITQQIGGTSASAPTWAGFIARFNEGLANASKAPLGFLNAKLYPLLLTSNFRDITSGGNGAYTSGTGYDLVTGIGVPVLSTLYSTLVGGTTSTVPTISSFSPSSGAVGTSVIITGSNFTGASSVKFNGTAASFTVNSATQITTTVPTGATTGTISITTSAGTATSVGSFTVGSITASQLLGNPGFENGTTATPWVASSGIIDNSSSPVAHAGFWKAWLDGYGAIHTDTLYQQVAIPAGVTSATLSFWLYITTAETTTSTAYDKLQVQVRNSSGTVLTTLATYSNLNKSTGYLQKSFSLSAYKGQTVQIYLIGTEDSSLQTSFLVDDFALNTQ